MSLKILLSPQVREKNKIWYEFDKQKITITIDEVTDTFDFTDMPDGDLRLWDEEGRDLVVTSLSEVPFLSAKKVDGVLWIEILFSISMYENDNRLLYPDWMSLDEFNDLMDELDGRELDDVKVIGEPPTDDYSEEEVLNNLFSNLATNEGWDEF